MIKDEAFGIIPILQQEHGYQFLLIQHHAGHWGFPKGHADPGETAIATACREFEEETGITDYTPLSDVCFAEHYRFTRDGKAIEKTVTYFPAWVKTDQVTCQPQEIKAYAWLSYEAALQKMTFDQGRQVLTKTNQYLTKLSGSA